MSSIFELITNSWSISVSDTLQRLNVNLDVAGVCPAVVPNVCLENRVHGRHRHEFKVGLGRPLNVQLIVGLADGFLSGESADELEFTDTGVDLRGGAVVAVGMNQAYAESDDREHYPVHNVFHGICPLVR